MGRWRLDECSDDVSEISRDNAAGGNRAEN